MWSDPALSVSSLTLCVCCFCGTGKGGGRRDQRERSETLATPVPARTARSPFWQPLAAGSFIGHMYVYVGGAG